MRTDLALPLLDLVHRGTESRPMTGAEIAGRLGIAPTEVRELVNWLRCKGDPILSMIASNDMGYWWCEKWDDMQHTLAHLGSRVERIDAARRGICRAFRRSEQQAEMVL